MNTNKEYIYQCKLCLKKFEIKYFNIGFVINKIKPCKYCLNVNKSYLFTLYPLLN